jgi:hypothetical protein
MKHGSSILLVGLFSAALMQLYRTHVELKCTCDVLAFQVRSQADMLRGTARYFSERTHRDAQKIGELEAQLKALTAGKTQSIDLRSAPATISETFPWLPGAANTGSHGFPNKLTKPTLMSI